VERPAVRVVAPNRIGQLRVTDKTALCSAQAIDQARELDLIARRRRHVERLAAMWAMAHMRH
jgi:hypothetical protein